MTPVAPQVPVRMKLAKLVFQYCAFIALAVPLGAGLSGSVFFIYLQDCGTRCAEGISEQGGNTELVVSGNNGLGTSAVRVNRYLQLFLHIGISRPMR